MQGTARASYTAGYSIDGDAGNDTLIGGPGRDKLYGGADNDIFVFGDPAESTVAGPDRIYDWNAGDKINLAGIDAASTLAGDHAFIFIGSAAFSGAGQLRAASGTDRRHRRPRRRWRG